MGYEDEPYCYLLVAPEDQHNDGSLGRVINTPRHRPGHVYVDVCAPSGNIETKCVTKKDKAEYKSAKDLTWGDRFL
jgi:ribosomal protein RSM22 (predicted rRNA methylase)